MDDVDARPGERRCGQQAPLQWCLPQRAGGADEEDSGPALWQQTLATVVLHDIDAPASGQLRAHLVQEPLSEALGLASTSLADARHILQHPPGQGAMVGQVQDPHGHGDEDARPSIHLDEPFPDAAEGGARWA